MAPGAEFCRGTLYRLKYRWRPKKKVFAAKRVDFQSESMWWPKKESLPTNQWVFGLKRKINSNVVTPKWWHPGRAAPPSDATDNIKYIARAWGQKQTNTFSMLMRTFASGQLSLAKVRALQLCVRPKLMNALSMLHWHSIGLYLNATTASTLLNQLCCIFKILVLVQ